MAGKPRCGMWRNVGGLRTAVARRPGQLAAIAGVPGTRDLIGDVVGIETAEVSGDEKGPALLRLIEMGEHAPAKRRTHHDPPGCT